MNILVTGAAGFIGSHTCERIIQLGHFVVGIDNFDNFYSIKIKRANLSNLLRNSQFKFYEIDIRNHEILNAALSVNQIDIVIHLAAKAGIHSSLNFVSDYFDVNVNGTISLLEAMKKNRIKKMLFGSSSSVYGNNKKIPFSENDNTDCPLSPYGVTKKSAELLCQVYTHLYDFDITCLRFFTVFGPRQRPDLAIHKFARLIDNRFPIPYYGDGTTGRDYTYIDDILNGINCALNHLKGFNIYNLGGSRVIDLNIMIKTIEIALNKKAIIHRMSLQPGDLPITYADISKAKVELGYNPKFNFKDGIDEFIKWYLKNKISLNG